MTNNHRIESTLDIILIFLIASASTYIIHRIRLQIYPDITICILITLFYFNKTPTQATITSLVTDLLFPQFYTNAIILTRIFLLLMFNITSQLFLSTPLFNLARPFILHSIIQLCYGIATGPHPSHWFIQNYIRVTTTNYIITIILILTWHKLNTKQNRA